MRISRRLRLQADRKNGSFRLASWALTVLAVGRGAWLARSGRGADTAAYFVCLTSITLSILLSTFDSPAANAIIGLIFVGFPLMAISSFLVPPDVGYFGQALQFCFGAVVAIIVGASLAARALRRNTVDKDKAFSQMFLGHLSVALVFLLASALSACQIRIADGPQPSPRPTQSVLPKTAARDEEFGSVVRIGPFEGTRSYYGQKWSDEAVRRPLKYHRP